jgi:hypothetical protein
MTTTQLFRALVYHQRGELDLDDFWKTIFGTNGVCDLPELEYQAIPKGNDEVEDQTEGTNDRRSNGS